MACYQAHTVAALVAHRLVRPGDQEAVEAALDFLFRVRNALHYRYGHKQDRLSVQDRELLAAALGFHASEPAHAVEAFLSTYDRHARVLLHLCETVMDAVSPTHKSRLWRSWQRPGKGNVLKRALLLANLTTQELFSRVARNFLSR
jgi:[protein-PII] uridylyltransferase